MGYLKLFNIIVQIFIAFCFILLFVYLSPNSCDCPSPALHYTIWITGGFMTYVITKVIFLDKQFIKSIFMKFFKLPIQEYQYQVKLCNVNGKDLYIPTVKTVRGYPPFYIKVEDDNYTLVDPEDNFKYYCKSKEDALYAISLVKKDLNEKVYKYKYDMWMCRICPIRNCDGKKKQSLASDLTVNLGKTFNK